MRHARPALAFLAAVFVAVAIIAPATLAPVTAQPSSTSYYPVYAAAHISTNTTTTALSGAGVLHAICINDQGAASNIATVYNNTAGSGTVLAVIDTVTATGCLVYDIATSTGITVVTGTGTAGDLTVAYRAIR